MTLHEARIDLGKMPKNIENHIIVCGIVRGIKDLIMPLRSKNLGAQKRPIVIISNDNTFSDTYVWPEINRFQDIYLIRGSALNPAVLDSANAHKARSIIIIATQLENKDASNATARLDADSIFMYRQIETKYKGVAIVTELESMSTVAFLVKENDPIHQTSNYYVSRPFAAGEIYVGSLLNSLMCQAYYNKSIMGILD